MITALISTGLALIALTGGMFLLAKTKRDVLGLFFKIGSYFIIIVSLLILMCTAFHGAIHFYGRFHKMPGYEKSMGSMGFHDGMEKQHSCCSGGSCSCMMMGGSGSGMMMHGDGYHEGYRDGCRDSYGWKHEGHDMYDWDKDKSYDEMRDTSNTKMGTEKNRKK